jgi:ABC-2 type transport system ATP-binding protein
MGVLNVDHVVKRFGDFTAVRDLSFSVPEGGIFGFLGGNGAGKTTTLRMALDILRPTSGTIEILGNAPGRQNAKFIGFLPEERGLYNRMTVHDIIVFFGRLRGMSPGDAAKSATALIDRLGLGEWSKSRIQKLSKGMSQKVQVAAAMVNAPKLLILDEPFSGLDPVNQAVLEELVLETAARGSTVIFSTHIMQHAERLSSRLVLLSRGQKVFEGTQEEARARLPSQLTLTAQNDPSSLPGVLSAERNAPANGGWPQWKVKLAPGADPGALLEACTSQGFPLRAFETHKPSLHDVFIHLVGGELDTPAPAPQGAAQ